MSKENVKHNDGVTVNKPQERFYQNRQSYDSDLFKLLLAKTHKNLAWTKGMVDIEKVEHTHFFRTYDSDGTKHQYSAAVAGHFHEITYEESKNGGPAIIKKVSGPLKWGTKMVRGIEKSIAVPLAEELEDFHTHEIEYLRSNKVEARVYNATAAHIIGEESVKGSSIPGIVG